MTELERKITADFVHGMMSKAEYFDLREFADAVQEMPEIPMLEPEVFSGLGNGKRSDAVQTSLFDTMMQELHAEKELRAEKFRKTHEVRNNGQAVQKDKRKCYYSRKVRYFDRDLDDRFPNKGKSMYMTIRRYRNDVAESVRRADCDAEIRPYAEHHVGKTTLSKQMNRKYAEMQKIAHDFCEKNGYQWGELYAYDPKDHYYHVDYPDEYYKVRSEYHVLRMECDERFVRKMQKGGCY